MSQQLEVDAELVVKLAALNGLELSLDRATPLAPVFRELLEVDRQIADLQIERLPSVGLPWQGEGSSSERHDLDILYASIADVGTRYRAGNAIAA